MIQAATCANTKTNKQKMKSIGIGMVKQNIHFKYIGISISF